MKTIVVDTNFLLIPYQFNVDIIEEIKRVCHFPYELKVIDKTVDELESIASGKTKHRPAANIGLAIIEKNNIKKIKTEENKDVDSHILSLEPKDLIVATQDQALKRALKEKGVSLLVLRNKSHVVLV